MAWFVYIVECYDKSFYTGICWSLKKRLKEHNEGRYKTAFTKGRLPVRLVYWQKHNNRFEAAKVEKVKEKHKTPWLSQWTLDTFEIPENKVEEVANKISKSLDYSHSSAWYADFKNDEYHYIIFRDKIFKIDRSKPEEYQEAIGYGISLGIPEYQVDFSPSIKEWKR